MKIAWVYLNKQWAAADALKDYASMVYILEHQAGVEQEMQERMTSIRPHPINGMPRNRNPQAFETRLASSLDEIDLLKERYRQALEYMEWFKPAWNALSDDDRYVLTEFYLSQRDEAIANICAHFTIERSSAYNKKNRALTRLALLLYGK